MPISNRLHLLEWASKQDAYIIEDDYDSEFHYTSKPLPSLQSLDREQRVLYVGSFSKVLTPFLRLGYLVVPESLIGLFKKIKWMTSGDTDPLKQSVVAEFIEAGHFGRHLKRMRQSYSQKMQWIADESEKQLSQWFEIGKQGAGMHLVITLKKKFNDQKLVTILNQKNIACKSLSEHYIYTPKSNGLILGFAHMQKEEIVRGISSIRHLMLENFGQIY
jgi:GntR family transcriptional regulator/MocR family aminotransferase